MTDANQQESDSLWSWLPFMWISSTMSSLPGRCTTSSRRSPANCRGPAATIYGTPPVASRYQLSNSLKIFLFHQFISDVTRLTLLKVQRIIRLNIRIEISGEKIGVVVLSAASSFQMSELIWNLEICVAFLTFVSCQLSNFVINHSIK